MKISSKLPLPPPQETREEIGQRLARKRMPMLKKRLKSIANLGNYKLPADYIENQLCAALDKWVSETKILLRNHQEEPDDEFRF